MTLQNVCSHLALYTVLLKREGSSFFDGCLALIRLKFMQICRMLRKNVVRFPGVLFALRRIRTGFETLPATC